MDQEDPMFYPRKDEMPYEASGPDEPGAVAATAPRRSGRLDLVVIVLLILAIAAALMFMFWPRVEQGEVPFEPIEVTSAQVPGLSEDGRYLIVEDVWPEHCGLPVADVRFTEEGDLRIKHAEINACFRGCGDPTPSYYRVGPFDDSQDSVQMVKGGSKIVYSRDG